MWQYPNSTSARLGHSTLTLPEKHAYFAACERPGDRVMPPRPYAGNCWRVRRARGFSPWTLGKICVAALWTPRGLEERGSAGPDPFPEEKKPVAGNGVARKRHSDFCALLSREWRCITLSRMPKPTPKSPSKSSKQPAAVAKISVTKPLPRKEKKR